MLRIGVIGCGSIGKEICGAIDKKLINARLVAVYDKSEQNYKRLLETLDTVPVMIPPDELISMADIVVECASQTAVREFGLRALERGRHLMVLSAGALMEPILREKLINAAIAHDCKIYVPSGAIAGLDGLKSASIAPLKRVTLATTKNPGGLKSAPYVIENNIELDSFRGKTLLFEGNAQEAVKAFPSNVNVAASLSLAGMGAKETRVRVFVDPKATMNIHEITVEGTFGIFTCRIENMPSPGNPKTSYLAALSAIATLKKIAEPLQIGT